ncbi:hypothetical protein [Acinetobacter sp. 18QD2AZ41W]|uniref:hypothetical protein n=1 Tax=Acinetobacter sp. 18QD2AZ41W TaxID=2692137 RepID=UPI00135B29B4|nr:hypothetical protein [Acinetobacter sp. 18QD2AZ41W]
MSEFKEFCLIENLSPVQIIGARKAWQHQEAGQHSMKAHIDELQETNLNLEGECVQLQKRLDAVKAIMNEYYTGSYEESAEMAGLISAALEGDHAT